MVEDHAIVGQKLTFPISYKVGEYLLYKSIQHDLLDYLSKAELVKVVKFYQTMWELDIAINESLQHWAHGREMCRLVV